MYLWRGYEKDTFIFTAKNAIVICLGLFEVCSICECQSTNAAIADDFLGGGGGCMGPSSADHYNRK